MCTEILFLTFNGLKFTTQTHDSFAYYFQKRKDRYSILPESLLGYFNDVINMNLMIGR
jgi:hypothetical protein